MICGQQIVDEARRWLGVPFLHQGRTKFGVDCVGLVICVREAVEPCGFVDDITRVYGRRPKDGLLLSIANKECVQIEAAEPGAVLIIKWPKDPTPSHTAILTTEGTMIHSYRGIEKVCEVGYRAQWVRWTYGFWRLPGVSNG